DAALARLAFARGEPDDAQHGVRATAEAAGQALCLAAVGGELPNVEFVVNQDVAVVAAPAGDAKRRGLRRRVPVLDGKADAQPGGQVRLLACGDGEAVPILAVEPERELAAGGEGWRPARRLQQRFLLAAADVDEGVIAQLGTIAGQQA